MKSDFFCKRISAISSIALLLMMFIVSALMRKLFPSLSEIERAVFVFSLCCIAVLFVGRYKKSKKTKSGIDMREASEELESLMSLNIATLGFVIVLTAVFAAIY